MPTPLFLAGEILPASKLQQLGDDDTYTPALTATTTNPGLGTSPTQDGQIWLNGQHVDIWFEIIFGTTATAGTGTYQISIPAAYTFAAVMRDGISIGTATLIDSSGAVTRRGIIVADTVNDVVTITDLADAAVTNASPWTWADGDTIAGHLTYLTDTP